MDEIAKNKFKAKDYEKASSMSGYEKKISFLNRYFVYKKIRTVNVDDVELELGEYADTAASRETEHAQEVAVEEVAAIKPKVRKLSKKLLLVAATDAIDDAPIPTKASKAKEPKEKKASVKVAKKALVIEGDDDDDEDA